MLSKSQLRCSATGKDLHLQLRQSPYPLGSPLFQTRVGGGGAKSTGAYSASVGGDRPDEPGFRGQILPWYF